jgi:hypothetical protein
MAISKEELKEQTLEQWEKLADECIVKAEEMLHAVVLGDQNDPHFGVRLSAVAVWCRSVNHLMGVRLLMQNSLIVEARTLVRCCYENLFWLGGLKEKGTAFLDQMAADNVSAKKALSHDLLNWAKKNSTNAESQQKLKDFLEELKTMEAKRIAHQEEAVRAGLGDTYTLYRIVSGDAAHPSAVSISRHVRDEEDGSMTISGPSLWIDQHEDLETWDFACGAFIMVSMAANEVLGQPKSEDLTGLFVKHALFSGMGGRISHGD